MTKIAFISDIHGNFEALQAVMTALKEEACDLTVCLGDIVGYGPCPSECVDYIRQNNIQAVLGNHDEYVTLLMDPHVERLREEIRIAIEWTQAQLSMDDLKWLAMLPFEMAAEDFFTIIHGSFAPGAALLLDGRRLPPISRARKSSWPSAVTAIPRSSALTVLMVRPWSITSAVANCRKRQKSWSTSARSASPETAIRAPARSPTWWKPGN